MNLKLIEVYGGWVYSLRMLRNRKLSLILFYFSFKFSNIFNSQQIIIKTFHASWGK